jgi:hypothetical protein
VLPALGTGTAGVSKGVFYAAAFDILEKCLNSKQGCYRYLPNRLVFSVWSGEGMTGWASTHDAIARTLAEFGNSWSNKYAPDQSVSKEARYLGIVIVLLTFVLLVDWHHGLPSAIAARVPVFEGSRLLLVVVGWGVASAGALAIFSDVIDSFIASEGPITPQRAVFNIGLGMVVAASCGLIERATEAFKSGSGRRPNL